SVSGLVKVFGGGLNEDGYESFNR
nr:hypothetical protein [Tanacetum cinerariifolium]